jgi:hypothetical protein
MPSKITKLAKGINPENQAILEAITKLVNVHLVYQGWSLIPVERQALSKSQILIQENTVRIPLKTKQEKQEIRQVLGGRAQNEIKDLLLIIANTTVLLA